MICCSFIFDEISSRSFQDLPGLHQLSLDRIPVTRFLGFDNRLTFQRIQNDPGAFLSAQSVIDQPVDGFHNRLFLSYEIGPRRKPMGWTWCSLPSGSKSVRSSSTLTDASRQLLYP